jgi:chondroitin synthase
MIMPDISVLIPSYNGAHTITRAIRSCFNGNAASVEVCVCDDASTDETLFTVHNALPELKRHIRVARHSKNKGTAEALNSAAFLARGRYMIILGDDDHFQHGALDALCAALKAREDIGFAYGSTRYYGNTERIHVPPPNFNPADFWRTYVSLYAVMFKREAWDSGLRFRDLITLENGRGLGVCDYDWTLQLIHAGYIGLSLPDVLVLNYLYSPNTRQTATVNQRQTEMVANFKALWSQWEGSSL